MSDLVEEVPELPELRVVDATPTAANPLAAAIALAVQELRRHAQVDMPVTHRYAPGVYIREIFMPAGTLVIGHIHKTCHFNIVLKGRALVQMEGRTEEIVAPCTFVSQAGVQKCLYIAEDMVWQTVHHNPSDSQDVVRWEEENVELSAELIETKGGRTLDQFRHDIATLPNPNNICPSL